MLLARNVLLGFAPLLACAGAALAACSGSSSGENDGAHPEDASAPDARSSTDAPPPQDSPLANPDGGIADAGQDCALGDAGEATDLACAGLYSDWPSKTVAKSVIEYDPGLHLWSDGAEKTRWIELPAGQQIDTSDMDEWTFPVGTKVWKEFRLALDGDGAAATRVETRLLWKQAPGVWYRTTYRWSDDGESSATELTTGEMNVGGTGYEVPTQQDCNRCHDGRLDGVLGFEAVALSTAGASGLTMQALVAQGLLTDPPATPIVVPGNATESAALSWLHTNCGISCHNTNPNALASGTSFYMRLDVATLTSVETTNTWTTGWNVPTGVFRIPNVPVTYRLHACDTGSSAAYFRASVRDGQNGVPAGRQMPPLDTHKVDEADLPLLAAWINQGCDAGAGDAAAVSDAGTDSANDGAVDDDGGTEDAAPDGP